MDYYDSAPVPHLTPGVKEFMEAAFTKSIPKAKRCRLSKEYPHPDTPVTKVPKLDMVFRTTLGKGTTDRSDEQLANTGNSPGGKCSSSQPLVTHGRPGNQGLD